MQEAQLRIEPGGLTGAAAIIHPHRIEERKQRVHAVTRRPPCPAVHLENGAQVVAHQKVQSLKVVACRLALDAAQNIKPCGRWQRAQAGRQIQCSAGQNGFIRSRLRFARTAQQNLALVLQLASNNGARHRQGEHGVILHRVLGTAQQNIATDRAFQSGFKATVSVKQNKRHAVVGQAVHQRRTDADMAHADHGLQVMQRDTQSRLLTHLHAQRVVIQPDVAFRCGDVERIEQLHVQCVATCRCRRLKAPGFR